LTVDASVAAKWLIEEDRRDLARDVLREGFELLAPDLLLVEVANALRNKVRNSLLDVEQAKNGLVILPRYFSQLIAPDGLLGAAFDIACSINHPVADCVYIACAMRIGAPLLTDDAKLFQKTKMLGATVSAIQLIDWTLGLPVNSAG
jgi:predicted nucleic acid-binding protein